jgi:hypothetical protein
LRTVPHPLLHEYYPFPSSICRFHNIFRRPFYRIVVDLQDVKVLKLCKVPWDACDFVALKAENLARAHLARLTRPGLRKHTRKLTREPGWLGSLLTLFRLMSRISREGMTVNCNNFSNI